MKLMSAVQVLGSLCLVFADVSSVPEGECPKIIRPDNVKMKAHLGKRLCLRCEALTNCDNDTALIYWLVNDSFPEDMPSKDRIVELEESSCNQGAVLKRSLLLKSVTSEDLKSTFTCVVTNAVGTARQDMTLVARRARKNRKPSMLVC